MNYPDFLERAFENNYSVVSDDTPLRFFKVVIGNIDIMKGKIIACDPFTLFNDIPFTETFPTGYFPVEIAIADIETDERIGFSRIRFSDALPVTWKMAVTEDQESESLEPGEIFGYGVDSGTGCYMDSSAHAEYLIKFQNEKYFDYLDREIEKTYKDTRSWLLWELNGATAAFFSTGYGDGIYASYIGYDSEGKICRLVTDFSLIDWDE